MADSNLERGGARVDPTLEYVLAKTFTGTRYQRASVYYQYCPQCREFEALIGNDTRHHYAPENLPRQWNAIMGDTPAWEPNPDATLAFMDGVPDLPIAEIYHVGPTTHLALNNEPEQEMAHEDAITWLHSHHARHLTRSHSRHRKPAHAPCIWDNAQTPTRIAAAAKRGKYTGISGLLRCVSDVRHIDTDALILDHTGAPVLLIEESHEPLSTKKNWASEAFVNEFGGMGFHVQTAHATSRRDALTRARIIGLGNHSNFTGNYFDFLAYIRPLLNAQA